MVDDTTYIYKKTKEDVNVTPANIPENHAEAEALARSFTEAIGRTDPASFNTMLAPEFIELNFDNRSMTLAHDFAGWMKNQVGIMHGGVIAAAADVAMGVLVYTFSGKKMPPTISLQTTYLRMVNPGGRLFARAYADKVGKTTASMRCEIWMENSPDELAATANGVYSTSGKTYDEWLSGR